MNMQRIRSTDELLREGLRSRASNRAVEGVSDLLWQIVRAAEVTPQRRAYGWRTLPPMPRRLAVIVAVALLLAALAGAIAVGSWVILRPKPTVIPTFHRNGEIVMSDGCGLVALDPVTGAKRTLVAGQSGCPYPSYYDVAWSPDGSRVAYRFDRFCGGCGSELARQTQGDIGIWVLTPATGDLLQVAGCKTSECEFQEPNWSPDGSRIAFEHDGHIWAIDADGANPARLTDPAAAQSFSGPTWSPDGTLIAFVGNSSTGAHVYTSHPDGSGKRVVFDGPGVFAESPAWSPDGQRVAFATRGGLESIRVVGADGSNPAVLLRGTSGQPEEPSWSPDGKRIAYVVARVANGGAGAEVQETRIGEIWVMGADGAGPQRIYKSSDCCAARWSGPTWAPDGRYVTFMQTQVEGTGSGAYVVAADGTGLRLLSEAPNLPEPPQPMAPPAWQPLPEDP
jgi:Tol biopolymer transport system component